MGWVRGGCFRRRMLQALSRPGKRILTRSFAGRKFTGRALGSTFMEAEEGKEAGSGRDRRRAAKSRLALQGTGKLAFKIVPSWGKGTGPFYPHINQSLHVGRAGKGA